MSSPVSKPDKARYVCDECQMACISEYHLNKHKSSHYDWKQCYECNLCDYSTLSLNQIKMHALKHVKMEQHTNKGATGSLSSCNGIQEGGSEAHGNMSQQSETSDQHIELVVIDSHDHTAAEVGQGSSGKEGDTVRSDSNTPRLPNGVIGERVHDTNKHTNRGSFGSDVEVLPAQGGEVDPEIPLIVLDSDTDEECIALPEQATNSGRTTSESLTSDDVKSADRSELTGNDEQVPTDQENTKPSEESQDTVYSCSDCLFTTPEIHSLLKHRETHLNNKCYKCDRCDFIAVQERYLHIHQQRQHATSSKHQCEHCPFSTKEAEAMEKHGKFHGADLPRKCPLCTFACSSHLQLSLHLKLHVKIETLPVVSANCHTADSTHAKASERSMPANNSIENSSEDSRESPATGNMQSAAGSISSSDTSGLPMEEQAVENCSLSEEGQSSERRQFNCEKCQFITNRRETLRTHMRIHSGEKPYSCPYCPYKARQRPNLNTHMNFHMIKSNFTCKYCSFSASSKASTRHHETLHEGLIYKDNNQSTPQNLQDSRIPENVNGSVQSQSAGESPKKSPRAKVTRDRRGFFRCSVCPFHTKHSTSIQRHLKIHQGSKPFKCKYCPYRAITLFQIQGHERHHDENLPHKCRWCHYFAETQAGVGIHEQRMHVGEYVQVNPQKQKQKQDKSLPLDLSMKKQNPVTSTPLNLSNSAGLEEVHVKKENILDEIIEEVDDDGKVIYKCKSCSFKTAWKENYYRHCRIHTGEKPFHCKHCPYKARSNMSWYRHMKHHTANYPFKCSMCTYRSLSLASVSSHENMVHGGTLHGDKNNSKKDSPSKPTGQPVKVAARLQCPLCQFTTARETLMKLHKAKHMSSGKAYKCTSCSFTTNLLANLHKHSVVHTSGKSYQCRYCPYATLYKAHLDRHEDHHTKASPSKFKCEQCSYSAGNLLGLTEHLKWHGESQQGMEASSELPMEACPDPEVDSELVETDMHEDEEHTELTWQPEVSSPARQSDEKDKVPFGTPGKTYECHSCDYQSKDLCAIKRHLRTHTGERPYQCQHCPYSARQVTNMHRHTAQHFADLPYKCPHCTYSVRNSSALAKHIKWHLPTTEEHVAPAEEVQQASASASFSQTSAEVSSKGKTAAKKHKRDTSRVHRCKWCPYTSVYLHNLHRHKTHHGAGFIHKCDLCSYSARNITGLQKHTELHEASARSTANAGHSASQSSSTLHLAAHENLDADSYVQLQPQWKCHTCGHIASSREELGKHMISHRNRRQRMCDVCPYRTRFPKTLWKHKRHHMIQRALKCKYCSYSSDFPRAIANHERVHVRHAAGMDSTSGQNSSESRDAFTCDSCPFTSPTLSGIMKHKTHHTANLTYKCKSCTYSASSLRVISYHQKVHVENTKKPYACDMCPFQSAFSKCLQKHRQHHFANLPLKCKYCSYTSGTPGAVTLHEKVHEIGPEKAFPSSSYNNRLCGVCGYIACSRARLVKHIRKHTGEKPFKCTKCPFRTSLEDTLAKHNKHHETNAAVKCKYCSYSSDMVRVVTSHEKLHEEETGDTQQSATLPSGNRMNSSCSEEVMKEDEAQNLQSPQQEYKCELCGYTAPSQRRMDEHMCTHTGFKPYGCDLCPYRTPLKETLARHKKHHTEDYPYKCRFCSYAAKRDFHVKEHEKVHALKQLPDLVTTSKGSSTVWAQSVNQIFECDVCDYTTRDKKRLVRHQRTHTGEKPYSCEFCPFKAALNETLWKHMKHHRIKSPMQCTKCSYSTTTSAALSNHNKVHEEENTADESGESQTVTQNGAVPNSTDFLCNICGYVTFQKSKLTKHLQWHALEKEHSCPSCPYRSSSKENVKRHQKHHKRKSPFRCQFCSYSANNTSVVKTHEKLHQGQQYPCHRKMPSVLFECVTCGMQHASQTDLDEHRRKQHPSEKCFQCPECPFVSQWEKALKKHRASHAANLPFKCRVCSFASPRKYVIRAHETTHKNVSLPTPLDEADKQTKKSHSKVYSCNLCPFRARQPREYETHLAGHEANHPFKCTHCTFSAREMRGLSSHLRVHSRHNQRILKCSSCGFSTTIASLMKLHEVKHKIHPKDGRVLNSRRKDDQQKKFFYCSHCSFKTHHSRAYKIHLLHHGAKLPFKCPHCTFACQLQRHLTRHINMQHRRPVDVTIPNQQNGPKDKTAQKTLVEKTAKQSESFQRYTEPSSAVFKCSRCKFTTKKKYLWLIHKGRHSEDKVFRCDECDFTTKCAGSVLPHLQWKHMGQWPRCLQCDECPYVTSDTRCLNNHKRHHTERYALGCTQCSYSTDLQHLLEKHFKVHSAKHKSKGPRASQRGFTGHTESLPQSEVYAEEESMDSRSTDPVSDVSGRPQKIAPRQCNFCGRRFFRKVEWKRHTKRHKEAPSGPQAHVVAHGDPVTGMLVYTFVCWFCGRRFNGQEEWYRHMQHHRF